MYIYIIFETIVNIFNCIIILVLFPVDRQLLVVFFFQTRIHIYICIEKLKNLNVINIVKQLTKTLSNALQGQLLFVGSAVEAFHQKSPISFLRFTCFQTGRS